MVALAVRRDDELAGFATKITRPIGGNCNLTLAARDQVSVNTI